MVRKQISDQITTFYPQKKKEKLTVNVSMMQMNWSSFKMFFKSLSFDTKFVMMASEVQKLHAFKI